MKRFLLLALMAAALVVLAEPQDAWGRGRSQCGVVYTPVYYYCPSAAYYMPHYNHQYSAPRYMPSTRPAVEVSAIDKRGFDPKTITIAPGTTVRWVNRGQERHTVTHRDGKFDSGPMSPGSTFSVTFVTPGTYEYFCKPHEKMGMVGTVVVKEGAPRGPGY